ncbi:hypothetical protein L210DRAFT_209093 [Boletus edulis BED1]|uniref:Uncharacterized protein n=1 Tax=Boletus edulis BED1 TaxID=1328754 RepID=A0AAD4GLA7_BOLED|nr:hypothetical protein L210DRAFT_209093 [Boletus edulis BED1]
MRSFSVHLHPMCCLLSFLPIRYHILWAIAMCCIMILVQVSETRNQARLNPGRAEEDLPQWRSHFSSVTSFSPTTFENVRPSNHLVLCSRHSGASVILSTGFLSVRRITISGYN